MAIKIALFSINEGVDCTKIAMQMANYFTGENEYKTAVVESGIKQKYKEFYITREDGIYELNGVCYIPCKTAYDENDYSIIIKDFGCVSALFSFTESFDKIYLCEKSNPSGIFEMSDFLTEQNISCDIMLFDASKEDLSVYKSYGYTCINMSYINNNICSYETSLLLSFLLRKNGKNPPEYKKDKEYPDFVYKKDMITPKKKKLSVFKKITKKSNAEEAQTEKESQAESETFENEVKKEQEEKEENTHPIIKTTPFYETNYINVPPPKPLEISKEEEKRQIAVEKEIALLQKQKIAEKEVRKAKEEEYEKRLREKEAEIEKLKENKEEKDRLEKEIALLREQRQEEEENSRKQEEEYKNRLREKEAEIEELKEKSVKEAEAKRTELEREIALLQEQRQREEENSKKQKEAYKNLLKEKEVEIEELKEKSVKEAEIKKTELEKEIVLLQEERREKEENSRKQKEEYKNRLREKEAEIEELKEKNAKEVEVKKTELEKEIALLQEQKQREEENSRKQKEEYKSRLREKETEIEKLKEKNAKEIESKRTELEKEISLLQEQKQKEEENSRKREAEYEKHLKEKEDEIRRLRQEKGWEKTKQKEHDKQNLIYKQELEEKKREIDRLKRQAEEQQKETDKDKEESFKKELRKKQAEIKKLGYQSTHDALTDVKNRAAFNEDIKNANNYTLIAFDVNDLKLANDHYGHEKGDLLLTEITKELCKIFDKESIYRTGGDEFIVLLKDFVNKEEAFSKTAKIDEMLDIKTKHSKDIKYQVAWGVAFSFEGEKEHVINLADERMYDNKRKKKSSCESAVKKEKEVIVTQPLSLKQEALKREVKRESPKGVFSKILSSLPLGNTKNALPFIGHLSIFVTSLRHSCGTSYISGSLASALTDIYNHDVWIDHKAGDILPDNIMVKEVITDEDRFLAYKNGIIVYDKGLYKDLDKDIKNEMLRCDVNIMVATADEVDLKNLSAFIKKEGENANRWLFVFNHVQPNQKSMLETAMRNYNHLIIPSHDYSEVPANIRNSWKDAICYCLNTM